MDTDGNLSIDLEEFQNSLIFCPRTSPIDITMFWRHSLNIDVGEDLTIPEDFTEEELKTGVWWKNLLGGGVAGGASRTCTAPIERLKLFIQVNATSNPKMTIVQGMKSLFNEGGFRSLWRGNGVYVLKVAPESALKFMAYERLKPLITQLRSAGANDITIADRFCAGSLAGAYSQTCIYPLEVLKTRMALRKSNEMNQGLLKAVVHLYRNEGLRAFYRGYIPSMCGIIPYAGTDLAVYETLKSFYQTKFEDKEPGTAVFLACGACSCTLGQLAAYPLIMIRDHS